MSAARCLSWSEDRSSAVVPSGDVRLPAGGGRGGRRDIFRGGGGMRGLAPQRLRARLWKRSSSRGSGVIGLEECDCAVASGWVVLAVERDHCAGWAGIAGRADHPGRERWLAGCEKVLGSRLGAVWVSPRRPADAIGAKNVRALALPGRHCGGVWAKVGWRGSLRAGRGARPRGAGSCGCERVWPRWSRRCVAVCVRGRRRRDR